MQYFGIRDLREKIGDYANQAQSGTMSVISRNGKPLTLNIPFDDQLIKLGAHKALAIKLYEEEILTLSKAARFAGVKTDEFIKLLGAAGINVLGNADDLKSELNQS
jgi:predicted HTH domain antitoxin